MSETENKFHRLPQYQGVFYELRCEQGPKKHKCPDCHFCQECSPSRCNVCRETESKPDCKLSLEEQIALYEKTNAEP